MLTGLTQDTITHIDRHLPYLRYTPAGELLIAGLRASDLIASQQTPLLLYIEDRLVENYQTIRRAFEHFFPRTQVFFALKTCYLSACVQALRSAGASIEVMSDIELQIALQNGFPPAQIVTNGIGRNQAYLERSLRSDVHLTVIDGIEDLLALQAMAKHQGVIADIGLRVIPPSHVDDLMIKPSSKLGMDWDGDVFLHTLQAALAMEEVRVRGILIHQFSHGRSPGQYADVLRGAARVIVALWEQLHVAFEIIDIGGGFDTRFLLEQEGGSILDFAREAHSTLSALPYDFTLHIEPGRYIIADAAVGITRILAEKRNKHLNWRICDIGSNILIPLPDIAYHPLPIRLPHQQEWHTFQIGDGTCAPSLVCPDAVLPAGQEGRELVLLNCGGYTTVFAELWAFPLPNILYLAGGQLTEIFGKAQFQHMMQTYYGYEIQ